MKRILLSWCGILAIAAAIALFGGVIAFFGRRYEPFIFCSSKLYYMVHPWLAITESIERGDNPAWATIAYHKSFSIECINVNQGFG